MKKAFSLVELMVVIGILGVLTAVLLSGFSGSTESARAAKCLSNMRTLALAASSEAKPYAATKEMSTLSSASGSNQDVYYEEKGWISANTKGFYTIWDTDKLKMVSTEEHEELPPISLYETDYDLAKYALENGWMYAKVNKSRETYVCPSHHKHSKKTPNWSYVMRSDNAKNMLEDDDPQDMAAERTLAFAEVQFLETSVNKSGLKETQTSTDAILQVEMDGEQECIGANHKVGKNVMAHVAFFDGHVEKLRVDGLSDADLKELTLWLIKGIPIGRNGNKYEELK